MCGNAAAYPFLLLFAPLEYLKNIPSQLNEKRGKMKKDFELSLLTEDLLKNPNKVVEVVQEKRSEDTNKIALQFFEAFKLSIFDKKKEFKEKLLKLEYLYPEIYISSYLLAQNYLIKKKFKKALHHAKLCEESKNKTSSEIEQKIVLAKNKFNDVSKDFLDYWNSVLNINKQRINNRFNLFTQDFGSTFMHGIEDGLSITKGLFSSNSGLFVPLEDYFDVIGVIYYENSLYTEAYCKFAAGIEIATSGDRKKLGLLYYHKALSDFFDSDYKKCLKDIYESAYHGYEEEVCLIIQSLAEHKLKNDSESKKNKEKAISKNKKMSELYDDILKEKNKQEKEKEDYQKQVIERKELQQKQIEKSIQDLKSEYGVEGSMTNDNLPSLSPLKIEEIIKETN